ncbi:MAG: hypothetical protein M1831_004025 [Alyxoria varia]|nr:MAG: hypothetical protein M1831_004025 [Alyxoria varia]
MAPIQGLRSVTGSQPQVPTPPKIVDGTLSVLPNELRIEILSLVLRDHYPDLERASKQLHIMEIPDEKNRLAGYYARKRGRRILNINKNMRAAAFEAIKTHCAWLDRHVKRLPETPPKEVHNGEDDESDDSESGSECSRFQPDLFGMARREKEVLQWLAKLYRSPPDPEDGGVRLDSTDEVRVQNHDCNWSFGHD